MPFSQSSSLCTAAADDERCSRLVYHHALPRHLFLLISVFNCSRLIYVQQELARYGSSVVPALSISPYLRCGVVSPSIPAFCVTREFSQNGQVYLRFACSCWSCVVPKVGTKMAPSLQHDEACIRIRTQKPRQRWFLTCSSVGPSETLATYTSVTPLPTVTAPTTSIAPNVRHFTL